MLVSLLAGWSVDGWVGGLVGGRLQLLLHVLLSFVIVGRLPLTADVVFFVLAVAIVAAAVAIVAAAVIIVAAAVAVAVAAAVVASLVRRMMPKIPGK